MANIASSADEVTGKVALVTGAASGIGRAIAELLHARGAKVVAEDIDPAVKQLERDRLITLTDDVTADGSAEKAVALAVDRFGALDILVNNAGRIIYKDLVDMTREDWNWQMETNVTGAFLHSREAAKVMMAKKSGAIVNIASYASYFAFPGIAAYTASKGALAQLTRTQALEAIQHGVRVNAIGVGDVVTNLLNHFRKDGSLRLWPRNRPTPEPLGRRGGAPRPDPPKTAGTASCGSRRIPPALIAHASADNRSGGSVCKRSPAILAI
jgi:NAD(P)-dependent dehydrogenase (short-subunit alcohol dehydrogenase family)